ncbi:unnamed protein product [Larinioides sclopetarius]|uniref:Uncharacterized protein n=1 Tax=Larinioides sclopetarius TaxID=280406 RepID=A0AAV2BN90_9ARAC
MLENATHLNLTEFLQLKELVSKLEVEFDKELNYSRQMFRRLFDVIDANPREITRQCLDARNHIDYSLLSSGEMEFKFLASLLSVVDCASLLTENENFVTDGKIDIDKVLCVMSVANIFVKNKLIKNKAMLNLIKNEEIFPQCDSLLGELPDETEMANLCKPEQIKMLKKLVSDVEAVVESKSRSVNERFRIILSWISDKESTLNNFREEEKYLCNKYRSGFRNFPFQMIAEDIDNIRKRIFAGHEWI